MKKIIFLGMFMLFNTLLFSCDKETTNEELRIYKTEKQATGGEANEDDPDEGENKTKT